MMRCAALLLFETLLIAICGVPKEKPVTLLFGNVGPL
jgi:hypothetical protein